jgi:hypothetical protein
LLGALATAPAEQLAHDHGDLGGSGCACVGGLDEQPDPAAEHVLHVQRALVGDGVGNFRAQVRVAFGQRAA